ncbi:hypothetical protein MMC13_005205 [Lambiella insularis]|nr:hypothetical protein [Lambiella insularis]
MADPATVIAIVNGSIGLAIKCAKVGQQLYDVADKFKKAELSLLSVREECEVIRLAWSRIAQWVKAWEDEAALDLELLHRLYQSIATGSTIISALEEDLNAFSNSSNVGGFKQRLKIVWEEKTFKSHQDRIRGLVGSMHLLLDVVKLPGADDRHRLLVKKDAILRRSDESAWTIIQSRPSSVTGSFRSRHSVESTEFEYRRLSFEDALFTAPVYKRNYARLAIVQAVRHNALQRSDTTVPSTERSIEQNSTVAVDLDAQIMLSELSEGSYNASTILRHYDESQMSSETATIRTFSITNESEDSNDHADPLLESAVEPIVSPGSDDLDTWHLDLAVAQSRYDILDKLLQQSTTDLSSTGMLRSSRTLWQPLDTAGTEPWNLRSLYEACRHGNEQMVELLVNRGLETHIQKKKDWTRPSAILLASGAGHVNVVRLLLSRGARIDDHNNDGSQPLHIAVSNRDVNMILFLLDNGADLYCRDFDNRQPIHHASRTCSLEVLDILIQAGASIEAVANWRRSPLHLVAEYEANGHRSSYHDMVDFISHLVLRGADLEAKDYNGNTPLQRAHYNGWSNGVRALLQAGAKEAAPFLGTDSPFFSALATRDATKMRGLPKMAYINALDPDIGAPLLRFIARGVQSADGSFSYSSSDILAVKFLLNNRISFNTSSVHYNALHNFAESAPLSISTGLSLQVAKEMISLLVENGDSIDGRSFAEGNACGGMTPLFLAARDLKVWLVQLLVDLRASKMTDALFSHLALDSQFATKARDQPESAVTVIALLGKTLHPDTFSLIPLLTASKRRRRVESIPPAFPESPTIPIVRSFTAAKTVSIIKSLDQHKPLDLLGNLQSESATAPLHTMLDQQGEYSPIQWDFGMNEVGIAL